MREENLKETVDIGFSVCLMPGQKRLIRLMPQRMVRVNRLYIEECFGVFLLRVECGKHEVGSAGDFPVSTLFYSVPTSEATVEKMKRLILRLEGKEVDYPDLLEFIEMKGDPNAVLGLPVTWPIVNIGNTLSLEFENRSHDPVRVTGVLRADAVLYS